MERSEAKLDKEQNEKQNLELVAKASLWEKIKDKMLQEFGENIYNSWLSKLQLLECSEFEIILSTPTKFIKDWIKKEYLDGKKRKKDGKEYFIAKGIKQLCLEINPKLKSFRIVVEKVKVANTNGKEVQNNNDTVAEVVSASKHDNVHTLGIDLNPNFRFENFVVGNSNKLACSSAKYVADTAEIDNNYNPLFLYSTVGLGKTHLIQSIAWHLKETQKDQTVVYMPAENFMYKFVMALKNKTIMEFKEQFRRVDVLIIDDIQFIAGKESTQAEFFHTFNALLENNKKIILACDRSPGDLTGIDERLKSRINGGMIVDIYAPDIELRLNILKQKAKLYGVEISEDVLKLIAEKITTSPRDLEGALKKLIAHKKFTKEEINTESATKLLKDIFRTSNKEITISGIKESVAKYYKINIADIDSKSRNKKFAFPRQVAMYLSKKLTTKSLSDIGKAFGGKNHATIIHAVNKIEELIKNDLHIEGDLRDIEKKI